MLPEVENRLSAKIELVQTSAQIILGVLLLGTLYVGWKRASAAERTVEVAQESQITERFTRAIEQLGSDKMAIRLGGIYALERIANDSAKDHWQIVQVLTAYIRDKPSWESGAETEKSDQAATTDIQAMLEVLGRLNTKYGETGRRIDLHNADLRGTNLRRINFHGIILMEANLEGIPLDEINLESADIRYSDFQKSYLTEANLQKANLTMADFQGADLRNANLRQAVLKNASFMGANLTSANLEGADLTGSRFGRMYIPRPGRELSDQHSLVTTLKGANLRGAKVRGADFQGADISGADFRTAVGLTQEQVDSANFDKPPKLPEHLVSRQEG